MTVIVHISDLHICKYHFNEEVFLKAVDEINELKPDMILLTGDITNEGYYREFLKAKEYLSLFDAPLYAIPGNHDSRNLGYESFEELIGERSWRLTKNNNFTVIGVDSSSPDVNGGNIGRPQQLWMDSQLDECLNDSNFTIVAMHHHVIPIPETGRERNVLSDAGDILKTLIDHKVDVVLCGHKHVANIWEMNGTLFINAGSLSSTKIRGKDLNSYNVYNISDENIEIYLNKINGTTSLLGNFKRNI
ncbi:metallophosphoesterase [Methanobrevibacter sp. OttesenSCG-928-K11]|nr:metallophosphoesterase [Methanobrevibacter sp. OttesenSCG-928-K11]MDL2270337.1 metallophosphoesterase [Methanobrevibacter sp. OttesenSCG-928-I08]